MNNENGFDLLVSVLFVMSPQLRGLGSKDQYLMISFRLGEGENLSQFHLRALQVRSKLLQLQDKSGQINHLA